MECGTAELKHGIMEPRAERTKTLRNPKRRNNGKSREVLNIKDGAIPGACLRGGVGESEEKEEICNLPAPLARGERFLQ